MQYPNGEEYIKAVQNPRLVFNDPALAGSVFDLHPLLQIPVPASGTTAVVFKATVSGRSQALRFFTREDASTRQRYTELNAWFDAHQLTPDVATSHWVDDAILVNSRRWPMVQMEWVDGLTLDRHVEDLVEADDRPALDGLAGSWRDLLRRTQAARFAHGDLQHGNVLVDTGGRLRLVDFDSSWIAPFAGSNPPTEGGHRNYQPTGRPWGPWMDTFPGLVIYLSLLALARDPKQWEQLNDGENLLFGQQDFAPPHQTRAWWQVAQLQDPRIDQMAARLRACCTPTWSAAGDLETLLRAPTPWWTRVGTPLGPPPPDAAPSPRRAPRRPAPRPRSATSHPSAPLPLVPHPMASPPSRRRLGRRRPAPLATPPEAGSQAVPDGTTTWWNSTGPHPARPAVEPPGQPTPRPKRRIGLSLLVGLLIWGLAGGMITAIVQGRPGSDAYDAAPGIGVLIGLVPGLLVFCVLALRWRTKP